MPSQPAMFQIVESDMEKEQRLCYRATGKEWTSFLQAAGLLEGKNKEEEEEKIESHVLSSEIPQFPKNGDLKHKGGEYSVVSIMGPQSSGKSTIMNMLFESNFTTMDHSKGRHQTTTGIWLSTAPKAENILIMDLEGTDALEREGNRGNVERQTSLMALTLSEVLIVNMWANDIGKASGMNVETLESILQANLRLFQPDSKTLLLFLIREQNPNDNDFGVTPAKLLEQSIRKVLDNIWNKIDKPDRFEKFYVHDLFDVQFFFLPPLVYFRKEFDQKVAELFTRFTDPNHPGYFFNTQYHLKKSVPPEGLFTWTTQIWDSVQNDESLNIPDQQKLLSAYRCEAALEESWTKFIEDTKPIAQELKQNYVEDFGGKINQIVSVCVKLYNDIGRKYDKEEAHKKYIDLVDKIETQVQYYLNLQMKHLKDEIVQQFNSQIKKQLPKHSCVDNLKSIIEDTAANVRKYFDTKCEECQIQTQNDFFNKDEYWNEFFKILREVTKTIQLEQWNYLNQEVEEVLQRELVDKMEDIFSDPSPRMWKKLSALRLEFHAKILEKYIINKLKNLMYEDDVLVDKIIDVKRSADKALMKTCQNKISRIGNALRKAFDDVFSKEKSGIPRQWLPGVDIGILYQQGQETGLELLKNCHKMELDGNEELQLEPIKEVFIGSDKLNQIRDEFIQYADESFRKAEEKIRWAEKGSKLLPDNPVTWLIFFLFAWNEIFALLKNPLLLFAAVIGIVVALIGYQAHMLGIDIKAAIWSIFGNFINIGLGYLNNLQNSHKASAVATSKYRKTSCRNGPTSG